MRKLAHPCHSHWETSLMDLGCVSTRGNVMTSRAKRKEHNRRVGRSVRNDFIVVPYSKSKMNELKELVSAKPFLHGDQVEYSAVGLSLARQMFALTMTGVRCMSKRRALTGTARKSFPQT